MADSRMLRMPHRQHVGALVLVMVLASAATAAAQQGVSGEWRVHGGDAGFTRYAALDQIDSETVGDLQIAWRREAVDASLRERWPELRYSNQLRSTPIMVDGVLYASNGIGLVEAFDPGTGETIWVQDATFLGDETPRGAPNRGVGWWESDDERRIFALRPPHLMAVDAETGQLIDSFGEAGLVDLTYDAATGYSGTSPPLVVKDVVILGSAMADHPFTKEQHPGDVRAYDVRTGALRWTWSPIPRAGEPGVETWLDNSWEYSGMSNVWTMFSADLELGYVYLPTGAPTNDMYGGHRPGNNLYANSLVCVDAATGEHVWHFQTVHHDLWDYDNNVAPILMDITVDGREVKAVVQLTKQAIAYTFDRVTGEPVWPIVERAVPGSNTPGRMDLTDAAVSDQAAPLRPPRHRHRRPDRLHAGDPGRGDRDRRAVHSGRDLHPAVDSRRGRDRHEGDAAASRLGRRGRMGRGPGSTPRPACSTCRRSPARSRPT